MKTVIGMLLLGVVLPALGSKCPQLYEEYGLSTNLNETIAHAIHSLTLNELRKFNPFAEELNGVPVVNPRVNDPKETARVVPHAPEEAIGTDFEGETMNTVDMILSEIGQPTDGLGPDWLPLERIVHTFHMKDLWAKIRENYDLVDQPEDDLCECLKDTKTNGIYDAVDWVAQHYQKGTMFILLNGPLPKLTDAKTWAVWRESLLHYYDTQALADVTTYLHCVLN